LSWQRSSASLDSHLARFPWSIRAHNPDGILIGPAVFAQMTAECPYTLQWDAPYPLRIAPSYGGSGPPSNTWFPGPTQVLNPNGILISAAVFAGLSSVTDRPTDHATRSITIGRIYVRTTAMRPTGNNNNERICNVQNKECSDMPVQARKHVGL